MEDIDFPLASLTNGLGSFWRRWSDIFGRSAWQGSIVTGRKIMKGRRWSFAIRANKNANTPVRSKGDIYKEES